MKKVVLLLILMASSSTLQAAGTLDWSNPGWTAGDLSNTYTGLGTENISATITITGTTNRFSDGGPLIDNDELFYEIDYFSSDIPTISTSIVFSQPVKNPSFTLSDIDEDVRFIFIPLLGTIRDVRFTDEVVLSAVDSLGNTIYPSITSSPYNFVSGANNNVITGDDNDNANNGLATVSFSGLVTSISFDYSNLAANPRNQAIGISDISWVDTEVDLSVTKSDSGAGFTPGGTGSYSIVVSNSVGSDPLVNGSISDTLPNGVTLNGAWSCSPAASCSPSSGGSSGDTAVNANVSLNPGASVTITVPVQYSADPSAY